MHISIFTTISDPIGRQDLYLEAIKNYLDFADEVIIIIGDHLRKDNSGLGEHMPIWFPKYDDKLRMSFYEWPKEFSWEFIGQQFQRGYDFCTGDWVLRMDIDYFIHEEDFETIREFLKNCKAPAAKVSKKQFLLVDRYRIKSLLPIAFNKGMYGDRIKLDSGGDLCQPSLDGKELPFDKIPTIMKPEIVTVSDNVTSGQRERRLPKSFEKDGVIYSLSQPLPIWNYECILRTKDVEVKEFARFARAWKRKFKSDRWGAESEEAAMKKFMEMQLGRFRGNKWEKIILEAHPKYIQETIKNLRSDQFGYSLWGNEKPAEYFKKAVG